MDENTQKLVSKQVEEIQDLKEKLAERESVILVLTGELIKKSMDPDYLPV